MPTFFFSGLGSLAAEKCVGHNNKKAVEGHFPYFISFAFISFSVVTIDQTNDFPLLFYKTFGGLT